jgi:PAS domain S-box-containing protein
MTRVKGVNPKNISLRLKAEKKLSSEHSRYTASVSEADTVKLIHELEVHHIELQMQNEELKAEIERADTATALYDFAPAGYFTLNYLGVICELNLTGARMLGIERSGLVNRNFVQFITSDMVPAFNAFLLKTIETYSRQSCEVRLMPKQSPAIFVHIEGICARDEQKCHIIAVDISERKRSEESLRISEMKYRRLHESMMDGYAYCDMKGNIVECNEACIQMLGYSADELYKLTYNDITPEKWHTLEAEILERQIMPLGYSQVYEKEYRRKDGTVFPVEIRTFLVRNDAGKNEGMWAIIRDITERKKAEEKIKRLNEKLEERVIERTTQLETANRELEAFSYSVSHDLRTPLRALNGFARILSDDYYHNLDTEGRRLLGIIMDNARKMGNLIDDLLSFSHLGRQEMKLMMIDMHALADSVYQELTSDTEKESISFRLSSIPDAFGDPSMVRQIWVNLIGNAIKFSSKKSKRVIEIGNKTMNGEKAYYVKDNGAGFDMKYADKLFGVFQRLHADDEFEGTGVGLAIVQRVIQRLKGRVWATGKINSGATFYFTLPAR